MTKRRRVWRTSFARVGTRSSPTPSLTAGSPSSTTSPRPPPAPATPQSHATGRCYTPSSKTSPPPLPTTRIYATNPTHPRIPSPLHHQENRNLRYRYRCATALPLAISLSPCCAVSPRSHSSFPLSFFFFRCAIFCCYSLCYICVFFFSLALIWVSIGFLCSLSSPILFCSVLVCALRTLFVVRFLCFASSLSHCSDLYNEKSIYIYLKTLYKMAYVLSYNLRL